ncbi:MAG: isopentenyl phosphate kinase, partial [Candidatus Micrarchaeia archaeon]
MLLVKLGGSAITYKDKPMRARIDVIERLAKEIAEALEQTGGRALIVHGAGSFGHPHVIKHGLADGFLKEKRKAQLRGFAITHNSVALLSGLINGALIHHGVPAVSLPPLALLRQKKKRISHFNIVPTRILLKNGFVPLLHGDIVFDEAIGCSV